MNALHSFPTLIGGNSAEPASDESTFRQVVFAPALLTLIMLAIAGVTCTMAAVNPVALIFPYFFYGVSFSGIAVLIYVFIEVAKLAPRGVDKPLKIVLASVRSRAAFLRRRCLYFRRSWWASTRPRSASRSSCRTRGMDF